MMPLARPPFRLSQSLPELFLASFSLSPLPGLFLTMAEHSLGKHGSSGTGKDGQAAFTQAEGKEAGPGIEVDKNKGLGQLAGSILPHILNLYNCQATALDYEVYSPDATFEDPLMCAHGIKQIKSAFYSIPKVFSEGKMVEYTVQEEETSPGSGEIRIDNLQHYKFLGRKIDMISLIKLQVEGGKVVRHEDLWDKKPLWNRETVKAPLVGRVVEKIRRGNMLVTHVFMGFGKDPRPNSL